MCFLNGTYSTASEQSMLDNCLIYGIVYVNECQAKKIFYWVNNL